MVRLATLLLFASTVGFAANWSGFLVDSRCYANEQSNVNKNTTTVDRDMNAEVRYCSPSAKTKGFALVLDDWNSLKFDSVGNAKAGALVGNANKKSVVKVTVSGNLNRDTIQVGSVSTVR
jgi:hypothetical protein